MDKKELRLQVWRAQWGLMTAEELKVVGQKIDGFVIGPRGPVPTDHFTVMSVGSPDPSGGQNTVTYRVIRPAADEYELYLLGTETVEDGSVTYLVFRDGDFLCPYSVDTHAGQVGPLVIVTLPATEEELENMA